MIKHMLASLLLIGIGIWMVLPTMACTDFSLKATDGSILITRSMEFALDMQSNLRSRNREQVFNMVGPEGKPGLRWKGKYGYVYLDGLNVDIAVDGMNEVGLSFGALLFPDFAIYQDVHTQTASQALPYLYFGDWVLSNFKTVDEVLKAIPHVVVINQTVPGMGNTIFPLHFSIHDATGKSVVVEYVNGKLNVYDNAIGVLTNSPTYGWHLTNLVNYLHLTPTNPQSIVDDGILFAATGQGFGMIGLPGDISPPSRFVKMAVLKRVVIPGIDAKSTLNLAEHLINNVDIPRGVAREPDSGKYTNDITQWVVFKDLTHKIFYYRTYGNLTLRSIDFSKLDFAPNAKHLKMAIANEQNVQDMTGQFAQSILLSQG